MTFAIRIATAALVCATAFWVLYSLYQEKKAQSERAKSPLRDPSFLRPPGEGLRLKLDHINDKLEEMTLTLGLVTIAAVAVILSTPMTSWFQTIISVGTILLICLPVIFIYKRRLRIVLNDLRNYRLGFDGERYVGQELNQLLAHNCRVFHDIEFDDFNIDHVVVAPTGIYAIETKTRRKRADGNGRYEFEVVFDGTQLIYPGFSDTHGIAQARNNALALGSWLKQITGISINVQPILTLPGWFVRETNLGPVRVLNPKVIHACILRKNAPKVDPALLDRAAAALAQKAVVKLD